MKTALTALIVTALLSGCAASAQPPPAVAAPVAPVTVACACACADDHHEGKHERRHPRKAGMREHRTDGDGPLAAGLRSLKLSDAQRSAIDPQLDAAREKRRQHQAQRRELHEAFAALDPAARDYAAQSQKLSERAAELARTEMVSRASLKSAVSAQLTPEQRQQWQAQQQARRNDRARPAPLETKPQP